MIVAAVPSPGARFASSVLTASLAGALLSCGPPVYEVVDREPGVRAPVTRACDETDPTRCLLPWPSSAFLEADPTSETGVRLAVPYDAINDRDEPGEFLTEANGFSRVTSAVVGFDGALRIDALGGPMGGVMRMFVASPDSPRYGEEVPLRIEGRVDNLRGVITSGLVGDPLEILDPDTEYVVVVTDALVFEDGSAVPAPHLARVAVGLDAPESQEEADVAGYHAPTRALLEAKGIAPERVLRVWDFVTRTEDDTTGPMLSMRNQAIAALEAGEVGVVIDTVTHRDDGGPVATVVEGHLTGLPNWLDAEGYLERGEDGLPVVMGTAEARFRVVIPVGEGDYRTVLFGHGAGGTVSDDSFDRDLTENGIAKVNVEFLGWTSDTIITTLAAVSGAVLAGARGAVSPLMQSVAHAVVIQRSVDSILGDALAADMLGGMPNPHAGRRPGRDGTLWVGGSLGGTMGLVITSVDDELRYAVLNVPGAAWSHWVRDSLLFNSLIATVRNRNGGELNVLTLVAMTQTLFDLVDGASFRRMAEEGGDVFLAQESMGDPVLPNAGNEFVGIATGATHLGAALSPIYGLPTEATEVVNGSAITQFRVPETGSFDIHGFAADQSRTAGQAAFEQIEAFLSSIWDTGTPVIRIPTLCPDGNCDFSR